VAAQEIVNWVTTAAAAVPDIGVASRIASVQTVGCVVLVTAVSAAAAAAVGLVTATAQCTSDVIRLLPVRIRQYSSLERTDAEI